MRPPVLDDQSGLLVALTQVPDLPLVGVEALSRLGIMVQLALAQNVSLQAEEREVLISLPDERARAEALAYTTDVSRLRPDLAPGLLLGVARNPFSPPDVLAEIMRSEEHYYAPLLLQNPSLPTDVALERARTLSPTLLFGGGRVHSTVKTSLALEAHPYLALTWMQEHDFSTRSVLAPDPRILPEVAHHLGSVDLLSSETFLLMTNPYVPDDLPLLASCPPAWRGGLLEARLDCYLGHDHPDDALIRALEASSEALDREVSACPLLRDEHYSMLVSREGASSSALAVARMSDRCDPGVSLEAFGRLPFMRELGDTTLSMTISRISSGAAPAPYGLDARTIHGLAQAYLGDSVASWESLLGLLPGWSCSLPDLFLAASRV